jgi:hypothetical protein
VGWLRNWIFRLGAAYLTAPLAVYPQRALLDPASLRRTLRPGDVVLVEGNQRVSEVIKFLTQSSWSHAALYVGDALTMRGENESDRIRELHGAEADHMLVEAVLGEGVIATPLEKYAHFNLRICRPIRIAPHHMAEVIDETIGQLGSHYDIRQVLDLARYFLPVSLIPSRFRRKALEVASTLTRDVICSSLIGGAFQSVRFPILPFVTTGTTPSPPEIGATASTPGTFHHKRLALITPRDFDLSPWFEIVKLNLQEAGHLDYRSIHWADKDTL